VFLQLSDSRRTASCDPLLPFLYMLLFLSDEELSFLVPHVCPITQETKHTHGDQVTCWICWKGSIMEAVSTLWDVRRTGHEGPFLNAKLAETRCEAEKRETGYGTPHGHVWEVGCKWKGKECTQIKAYGTRAITSTHRISTMSDVTAKVAKAKEIKQLGDEAFKEGRLQAGASPSSSREKVL
jgi:hypothetical protein